MNTRRTDIVNLINEKGKVSFKDLKAAFPDVSDMTLRRDLESLDQEKKIIRVYGGARSAGMLIGMESKLSERAMNNGWQKQQIAEKTLPLLTPNCAIYIDSGTTTLELAKRMPDFDIIVFTGSLGVALELAHLEKVKVNLFGGRLNRRSLCVPGNERLEEELNDVNLSYAFFGVTGFLDSRGFTCGDEKEYRLKKMIAQRADKNVVLMDTSKLGIASTYTFATLDNIDIIVSDGNLPARQIQTFQKRGIEVL